jgi:hypothetical protein
MPGISQALSRRQTGTGGILAALCRLAMIGADVNLGRVRETGRKIDL